MAASWLIAAFQADLTVCCKTPSCRNNAQLEPLGALPVDQFLRATPFRPVQQQPHLPIVKTSRHTTPHHRFRRGVTGVKRRAIIAAMVIALATPAFADISDYESMHRRIADALGSRAQADAAYDKLMQEANSYGQPIDWVVDQFIALCTASDECNP
jgi:hypothetical protein